MFSQRDCEFVGFGWFRDVGLSGLEFRVKGWNLLHSDGYF